MNNDFFETNRKLWNNKTGIHVHSEFYDNDAFLRGKTSLNEIELSEIGDVKGKSLLHLQCHFGQDTLSFQRMGATATGLDFSEEGIKVARAQNLKLGLSSSFICANVLDTCKVIESQFDIVFTSYGTICWLPDIKPWAKVIADSLVHGGYFYIADFHPVLLMYDFGSKKIEFSYKNRGEAYVEYEQGTYADKSADIAQKEYYWTHGLSEIINALLSEGLKLELFNEHFYSPYNCFEDMTEISPGKFLFDHFKYPLPHVYSMKFIKI